MTLSCSETFTSSSSKTSPTVSALSFVCLSSCLPTLTLMVFGVVTSRRMPLREIVASRLVERSAVEPISPRALATSVEFTQ